MDESSYDPYGCDYCGAGFDASQGGYLRPIGFTEFAGHRAPLVKTWCGNCDPDDECDPEAHAAVRAAITTPGPDAADAMIAEG